MARYTENWLILAFCAVIIRQSSGACDPSYTEVGGTCILVLPEARLPYLEAQELCEVYYGTLAVVKDCNLLGSLAKFIDSNYPGLGGADGAWIGGSDLAEEGTWMWMDRTPVQMGAPFWARNHLSESSPEPSGGTAENCAAMSTGAGFYFQDINCANSNFSPLCERPPVNAETGECPPPYVGVGGRCLEFLSPVQVPWDGALAVCQSSLGSLAIVDDCSLITDVVAYATDNGLIPSHGYWIGGSDSAAEGTWTWVDGSSMAMGVPFWGRDGSGSLEPNDFNGHEDCLAVWGPRRYHFNDARCDKLLPPVCQSEPLP